MKKMNFFSKRTVTGANPTIIEFTATTPTFLNRRKVIFNLKTCHAINSAVNFYNAGVVTRDCRIGSRIIFIFSRLTTDIFVIKK
jgi:hypothetical protein